MARGAVTNEIGYYEVSALIAGSYRISAVHTGFRETIQEGVTVEANGHLNAPVQLAPGVVTQSVTVQEEAILLNTESGRQGEVLTTKQVESLPTSGVNPMWLVQMAPGVAPAQGQSSSTDGTLGWNGVNNGTAVYGIASRIEFSLDGAPNMQNRSNALNPSEEEMGEMTMDTSGFDASVGHSIGASVTMTTKAGTNTLHGSLRDDFTNKRWAAMGHFQGDNYKYQSQKAGCTSYDSSSACRGIMNLYGWPGVHEHNIGMALGGPIYIPKVIDGRNKLFFFQSISIDDFNGLGTSSIHLPTVQERSGNFTDLIDPAHPAAPAGFVAACPGATYYGRYQIYNPFSVQLGL